MAVKARPPAVVISTVVALQAISAVFFIADVIADVITEGVGPHVVIEGFVASGLVAGVVFGAWHVRGLVAEGRRREQALAVASGALGDVIGLRFTEWGLTPAEADVAFLALKGCDVGQIATIRNAAPGTVRAQLTRTYAKAGVASRAELIGHFFEDLLGEGIPEIRHPDG